MKEIDSDYAQGQPNSRVPGWGGILPTAELVSLPLPHSDPGC